MKIIDILNKIANGTLENGAIVEYDKILYLYNKDNNTLMNSEEDFLCNVTVEKHLNDEVRLYKTETKVTEIEKPKEIETLPEFEDTNNYNWSDVKLNRIKINELVQAVNNLIKESEKQ